MRRLASIATLVLLAGASACGARSAQSSGRHDGARPSDGPRDGPRPRDTATPRLDTRRPDSCLPIPASRVVGKYRGSWKGTYKCPSVPGATVSGSLQFTLLAASRPEAFTVRGEMTGMVQPFQLPFSTSISGAMGCTALAADLPDINVSGLLGRGRIVATFSSSPLGFPSGTWTASLASMSCNASGVWSATQQ